MKLTFYNRLDEIRDHIQDCQKEGHVQQVAYSTYHDGITQICFTCNEVRTNIDHPYCDHIDDKPEPPYEHKWLHNKWRTDYLTQCALDTLCNPHEFEPKLDTRFKYHVCQKCGIVVFKGDKLEKIKLPPDLPSYEPGLHYWMEQITKAVNSLKGE